MRVQKKAVLALPVVFILIPTAAAAPQAEMLTLHASPALVTHNRPVALTGTATGVPAGTGIGLDESPYPYSSKTPIATTVTDAQGNFSFTVHPDRNTRYIAVDPSTSIEATAQVDVQDKWVTKVRHLPLGRAMVTVLVFHPRDLKWNGARVHWWFSEGGGRFSPAPSTTTRGLGPNVAVVRTVITLPAGWFHWRACFSAKGVGAFHDPQTPRGCTGLGYRGSGYLPVGFPGPGAIARAGGYLASRGGRTALAVVDSEGRLSGSNIHSTFITGSVVKAMLLVAYLRRLGALGQRFVDSGSNSFLYPMINVSDNNAATTCYSIVGNGGLYSVAAAAGMTEFSVSSGWGSAMISAADQARFFFEMDSLIPRQFVGYARNLLSTIAAFESWGIPAIARPLGYNVFFKGGWRPSPNIWLVHQIARLEGHGRTFSMAVMTDGDSGMGDGIQKIQGATQALLG